MKRFGRQVRAHPDFMLAALAAAVWILLAASAPLTVPYDPFHTDLGQRLLSPGAAHWMGTDQLGRDELSRVLWGGRVTLSLAFLIVGVTASAGILLGAASAAAEGKTDAVFSRILDFFLAFPPLVLSIALVGILGPDLTNLILSLMITHWAEYARLARNLVLAEKGKGYVRFAVFSGASHMCIMIRFILPNVVPGILVVICQNIGDIVLAVAGLSLIGIGVPPPWPEWGTLLMGSRDYLQTAPWLLAAPGAAIFITVMISNLMGDSLRDILDPYEASVHPPVSKQKKERSL